MFVGDNWVLCHVAFRKTCAGSVICCWTKYEHSVPLRHHASVYSRDCCTLHNDWCGLLSKVFNNPVSFSISCACL